MKTLLIATVMFVTAGAAQAQMGTQQPGMQMPPAATAPSAGAPADAGTPDPATVKPKGQIITLKSPTDRKVANLRAHCFNGTVYWDPQSAEGLYYCDGKDAPAPKSK